MSAGLRNGTVSAAPPRYKVRMFFGEWICVCRSTRISNFPKNIVVKNSISHVHHLGEIPSQSTPFSSFCCAHKLKPHPHIVHDPSLRDWKPMLIAGYKNYLDVRLNYLQCIVIVWPKYLEDLPVN